MNLGHTDIPTLFPGMQFAPRIATCPVDITARKHKGNAESIAANPSELRKRESHERILTLLRESNLTSKEIAARLGVEIHTISGRLSELKQMGKIVATGIRTDGAAVLRIVR